jgi:5-methylcytosine-specific restriction enzyme A
MPLHETLRTIITDYPLATKQTFAGHPLGAFIRQEAANAAEGALGDLGAGLLVEGSAGAGNWAAVPWISMFDPAITTSATHGYYVVYLFHVSDPVVHLSLN